MTPTPTRPVIDATSPVAAPSKRGDGQADAAFRNALARLAPGNSEHDPLAPMPETEPAEARRVDTRRSASGGPHIEHSHRNPPTDRATTEEAPAESTSVATLPLPSGLMASQEIAWRRSQAHPSDDEQQVSRAQSVPLVAAEGSAPLSLPMTRAPRGVEVVHIQTQSVVGTKERWQSEPWQSPRTDHTDTRTSPMARHRRDLDTIASIAHEGAVEAIVSRTGATDVVENTTVPHGAGLGAAAAHVLNAIIDIAGSANAADAQSTKTVVASAEPGKLSQPVRTITLHLSPSWLGVVEVQMTTGPETLRVRLTAEVAATAASLERDRDALVRKLSASGYPPADLLISHATSRPESLADSAQAAPRGPGSGDTSNAYAEPSPRERHPKRPGTSAPSGVTDRSTIPPSDPVPNARRWSTVANRAPFSELRVLRSV